MSMDLFRKNQRIIFIIVAIIVIPSFAIVWSGADMFSASGQPEFDVATVNGRPFRASEFEAFQKRIQAALAGAPLQVPNAPGIGTRYEELNKYVFAYALLDDAQKAGTTVSDLQVGTYLESAHPVIAAGFDRTDRASLERSVDAFCRQQQISKTELLRGIREWQTIGNYLDADANLSALSDDTVFAFYALNKAEVVVKRVKVGVTDSLTEQARGEVTAKPAADLEAEARSYAAAHSDAPNYRTPASWRFAYVFTPFVAADAVRQPTDDEIQAAYDAGRAAVYAGEPLDAVRGRIRADLVDREIERQTYRNVNIDIDPALRGEGAENLDELVKLARIAKYGVTAGDSGAELLPAAELAGKLPAGLDLQLEIILQELDRLPPADVNARKGTFILDLPPLRGTGGFVRLRLLDYLASAPAALDAADGSLKPEILELAATDLTRERAEELARDTAMQTEEKLRAFLTARAAGEAAPDAEVAEEFAALPTETITYMQIPQADYALGRLTVGDLMGPNEGRDPATGALTLELVVMVERRIPTRADFEAESADEKARYRNLAMSNYRGSYGFTFTPEGPVAMIQPGTAILGGLSDRFTRGEIAINPELFAAAE